MKEIEGPKTLLEAIRYFENEDNCFNTLKAIRFPDGIIPCPSCGHKDHYFLATRRLWKCKACKRQFSIKVGTIFEDSPIKLSKWLPAIWMICGAKNGISSYEIHRALGITQKSAWFVLHRIRLAMQSGSFDKLIDDVEADETFIGGRAINMHKHIRAKKITGTGGKNMTAVLGLLERGGNVRTFVVEKRDRATLNEIVPQHVDFGCNLYTDAWSGYRDMPLKFRHQVVDHAVSYVEGKVHTNGMENFWSLLKRTIRGTYVSVEPFHLFRYLDEQAFRFNERKGTDADRFQTTLSQVSGRRVTYNQLTGKTRLAQLGA